MTQRSRSLLVRQRTMLANALRAHLAELGFVTNPGIANLAKLTDQVLANKDAFPSYASAAVEILIRQIMGVSSQIAVLDQQLAAWHAESEARSEERRVGKEWGSTCRSRWSRYP